jgi:uncharacterized membrane protein YfcA
VGLYCVQLGCGSMTSPILTILTVAALLTATLSGFLGMGGGMVLLGVMALVLPPAMVVPIHGAVQLCSNGTRSLLFLRDVNWSIVGIYALPSALGLYAATWMWEGDRLDWFKPLIGVFILLFLVYRRYKPSLRNVPLWVYAPVGLVVGFLAIFVGAVGPFLAPFFLRDDFKKENVIATKSVCQLWVHLGKLPAFFSLGFDYGGHLNLLGFLVVAVVVGTYAGKALLGRMSESFFLKIFQFVLAGIALILIVDGFGMW